jgi:ribosome-binding factor A
MSRLQRVNQLIREEISYLIQRELKDPRLGFVTVTEVDVSKDLRTAKVYVSVLGPETDWQASLQALESACGFIRTGLSHGPPPTVPHFTFHPDRSMAHAAHIQALLERLREERPEPTAEPEAST